MHDDIISLMINVLKNLFNDTHLEVYLKIIYFCQLQNIPFQKLIGLFFQKSLWNWNVKTDTDSDLSLDSTLLLVVLLLVLQSTLSTLLKVYSTVSTDYSLCSL